MDLGNKIKNYYIDLRDKDLKIKEIGDIDKEDFKNYLFLNLEEYDEKTKKILEFMIKEEIGYSELLDVIDKITVDKYFPDPDFENTYIGIWENRKLKKYCNKKV